MSSNQSSDNLVQSIANAYLLANTTSTEAVKQVQLSKIHSNEQTELAKIQLEREKLLPPEDRLRYIQNGQWNEEFKILRYRLVDWSHNRCSPITHHSRADEGEVFLMTQAQKLVPSSADKLPTLFSKQKETCGTSQQFHNIYRWLIEAIKERK